MLFVSVIIMIILIFLLLVPHVFFSKLLNIYCNVFLWCPFLQNISVRYSISSLKYFSEQILVALARNPLNMLVIVSGGIQECGLICTFVRAGFRWTSNSYLPLLFFYFNVQKVTYWIIFYGCFIWKLRSEFGTQSHCRSIDHKSGSKNI